MFRSSVRTQLKSIRNSEVTSWKGINVQMTMLKPLLWRQRWRGSRRWWGSYTDLRSNSLSNACWLNRLQEGVDIFSLTQLLKERSQLEQFFVFHIVKPGDAGNSVLRMKDVRSWRIIQDNNLTKLPSQATQVFHVVAPVEDARLSKESSSEYIPFIQQVLKERMHYYLDVCSGII